MQLEKTPVPVQLQKHLPYSPAFPSLYQEEVALATPAPGSAAKTLGGRPARASTGAVVSDGAESGCPPWAKHQYAPPISTTNKS